MSKGMLPLIILVLVLGSAVIVFGKLNVAKTILVLFAAAVAIGAIFFGYDAYESKVQNDTAEAQYAEYERVGRCVKALSPEVLSKYTDYEIGQRVVTRSGLSIEDAPPTCAEVDTWLKSVNAE